MRQREDLFDGVYDSTTLRKDIDDLQRHIVSLKERVKALEDWKDAGNLPTSSIPFT